MLGHSQAGLFATWMMFYNSYVFKKYIILSPSLWVENAKMIQENVNFKIDNKIEAYFAAGSLEIDKSGNMAENLSHLYNKISNNDNLKSKFEVFSDENHAIMVPIGITKGLKFLFKK